MELNANLVQHWARNFQMLPSLLPKPRFMTAKYLPAQSPDKFELVVNVKTAKALGLPLRDAFLQICDEVIE